MDQREIDWLRGRRERDYAQRAGRSPVVAGRRSWHRPGELLLDLPAEGHLGDFLTDRHRGKRHIPDGGQHDWRSRHGLPAERADLNATLGPVGRRLWTVDPATDLPALVDELRDRLPDPAPGSVAVNHVLSGEPIYQGGPGGEPFRIEPLAVVVPPPRPRAGGPHLAVLDTGLPVDWSLAHGRLAAALIPDLDDRNRLYAHGGQELATQAGHGLFICGLVHRVAPELQVDPGRVLDATGLGDDATIAAELAETTAPVISLSLGCYTDDDDPPPALAAALAAKGPDVLVVAAAGNNSSTRPFWPAAADNVLAVAAYDSTADAPAGFTNTGPWVDVCAPGVKVLSAYVTGTWVAHDNDRRAFEGWAGWSGTSFAAPLVAAELARRVTDPARQGTPRQVLDAFLAELPPAPWDGAGRRYTPAVDPTGRP
jgi:hypothetical protein